MKLVRDKLSDDKSTVIGGEFDVFSPANPPNYMTDLIRGVIFKFHTATNLSLILKPKVV